MGMARSALEVSAKSFCATYLDMRKVNEMVQEADLNGDGKVNFRGQCKVILCYLLECEKRSKRWYKRQT